MSDETGTDGPARTFPVDLVVVLVFVAGVALTSLVADPVLSLARPVFAVLAVLLPGYSLIAALFPRGPPEPGGRRKFADRIRRLDAFDRAALSVSTGVVVTPLLGIAVHFSPLPIAAAPILWTVTAFVVVTAGIAAIRRRRLPPAERFAPARRWHRIAVGAVGWPGQVGFVTVVVTIAVFVAVGGVFAVASTAQTGESFTEFAVTTETESGQLVAGSYPETLSTGTATPFVLLVENREGERATYTVVTKLQRLADDDETRVLDHETYDPVRVTVDSGRTARIEHAVTPTMTGERLRLVFLLYRGAPPEETNPTNAYRRTHVWVTVRG